MEIRKDGYCFSNTFLIPAFPYLKAGNEKCMEIKYFIGNEVIVKSTGEIGRVLMTPYSNKGKYRIYIVQNRQVKEIDMDENELEKGGGKYD